MNYFIQQECIQLIKSDNNYITTEYLKYNNVKYKNNISDKWYSLNSLFITESRKNYHSFHKPRQKNPSRTTLCRV